MGENRAKRDVYQRETLALMMEESRVLAVTRVSGRNPLF